MTRITSARNLAAFAAVLLLATACAGGMAGNRPTFHTWPSGTTVTYEMVTNQTVMISIPGGGDQEMPTTSSMTFEVTAAGPRTFEMTVVDVVSEAVSDMPAGIAPEATELIGASGTVTLDANGVVIENSGFEGNSYVDFMGAEAFAEQSVQVLFQYLPEGGPAVGQEWSREYTYPFNMMGIALDFSNEDSYVCLEELTYEGIPALRIGSTTSNAMSGGGEMMGTVMDMALAGSSEGTTVIDAMTGMILESDATITMGGGISAQGMDIPFDMEMRITIRRK